MTGLEAESKETVLEFLRRGRKGFYPSAIRTCEGDLFLICDALEDYANICEQYIERERDKLTAYQVGAIECRIERYRYIAGKYAAAIGYDREKAMARCAKRRAAEGREGVGEEALSALVRYGAVESRKAKTDKKAGETHEEKKAN